ncbi:MAG: hypothetical protein PHQ23_00095 [Candidatus Wallbacteria bacterium]|nr:hypothetical protein [Candidatus Wallbacteria bacterium]
MKRFPFSWLFFIIPACLIFAPQAFCASEDPELDDAYIAMILGKIRGNGFFHVKSDYDENPFVPMQEILVNWLDFIDESTQAYSSRKMFVLNPGRRQYWVDIEQKVAGNPEGTIVLPPESIAESEGQVWIRYDQLSRWLPVEASWNLNQYALRIEPGFKTRRMLEWERELSVKRSEADKKFREDLDKALVYRPMPGAVSARFTIQLNATRNEKEREEHTPMEGELNIDTELGDFYIDYDNDFADAKKNDSPIDDLRQISLTVRDRFDLSRIVLGDSYTLRQEIFDGTRVIRGVAVKKNATDQFDINLSFQRPFPAGTGIDVFRNGLFIKTLKVDQGGYADFSDIPASSGDSFLWKVYYPDRDQKDIRLTVPHDRGYILPVGQSDFFVSNGYENGHSTEELHYVNVRYGFMKNLSLGYYHLNTPAVIGDPLDVTGINVAFMPNMRTMMVAETAKVADARVYQLNTNLEINEATKMEIKNRRTDAEGIPPAADGYANYKYENSVSLNSRMFGSAINCRFDERDKNRMLGMYFSKPFVAGPLGVLRLNIDNIRDLTYGKNDFQLGLEKGIADYRINLTGNFSGSGGSEGFGIDISQRSEKINQFQFFTRSSESGSTRVLSFSRENFKVGWTNSESAAEDVNSVNVELSGFNRTVNLSGNYNIESQDSASICA